MVFLALISRKIHQSVNWAFVYPDSFGSMRIVDYNFKTHGKLI